MWWSTISGGRPAVRSEDPKFEFSRNNSGRIALSILYSSPILSRLPPRLPCRLSTKKALSEGTGNRGVQHKSPNNVFDDAGNP